MALPFSAPQPSPAGLQELTFEVGPTQEPKQLRAALYAVSPGEAPGSDEFIGSGRWVLGKTACLDLARVGWIGTGLHRCGRG